MEKTFFSGLSRYSPASPRLISQGEQAVALATHLLPGAQWYPFSDAAGALTLRAGAIWPDDTMLIYTSPSAFVYARGEQLFECPPAVFLPELPIVCLESCDTAQLQSLLMPWYRLLRMNLAHSGRFFFYHRALVLTALRQCPFVLQLLIDCRYRYAKLFAPLPPTAAAGLIMENLPRRITQEDIAYFITRLISDRARQPEKTIGSMVRIARSAAQIIKELDEAQQRAYYIAIAWLATKIALLVFMPLAGMVFPTADYETLRARLMNYYGAMLAEILAAEGFQISQAEAEQALAELLADTHAVIKLRDLEGLLTAFLPVIAALYQAIEIES